MSNAYSPQAGQLAFEWITEVGVSLEFGECRAHLSLWFGRQLLEHVGRLSKEEHASTWHDLRKPPPRGACRGRTRGPRRGRAHAGSGGSPRRTRGRTGARGWRRGSSPRRG